MIKLFSARQHNM